MRTRLKNINRYFLDRSVASFSAQLPPGARVIDVGAGGGHYRHLFSEQAYFALDRGYEQSSHAGLDVVADIRMMPCAEGGADAAICIEVIEHVFETTQLLGELSRIIRPGGLLLLTSPLCFGEHMQPWDFYRFTRSALEKLLTDAKFEIESLEARGGFFTLTAYLVARIPDELMRSLQPHWYAKPLKIMSRMLCTYFFAPLLLALDSLDHKQRFTLGYACVARRTPNQG